MLRARNIALAMIVLLAGCHGDRTTSPAPITLRLSFGTKSFAISLGQWMRLTMEIVSSAGDSTVAPASVLLVSRDPAVVRIDSGTKVQSIGMGETWIVASLDTAGQTLIDSLAVSVACTLELTPVVTPQTQTLAIGQSFTPSVKLLTCGGRITRTDTYHWTASDSTIIRVDSLSGTTTGVRPGQAGVFVRSATNGGLYGVVSVTVTP
jgi:hypothetical protein